MRRIALALLSGLVAVGLVHAGSVDVDFDPKAQFENYRTWAWVPDRGEGHHGVLADQTMRDRVEKAISIRLREAGLTAAAPGTDADVLVRYQGDIGQGQSGSSNLRNVYTWTDPAYVSVQFTEQTATLIVDLVDGGSKSLAWRLYLHQTFAGASDSPTKLSDALDKGFAKYPPSASARAKKAKKLAKESGSR